MYKTKTFCKYDKISGEKLLKYAENVGNFDIQISNKAMKKKSKNNIFQKNQNKSFK